MNLEQDQVLVETGENDDKSEVSDTPFSRVVAPHKKVSRKATEEDIPRILEEAQVMVDICAVAPWLPALSHSEIDDTDPLQFFVTAGGRLIINPRIIRHTNFPVDSVEGCAAFPPMMQKTVGRYHKIDLEFLSLDEDTNTFTPVLTIALSGREARSVQHQLAHMNGKYLFDDDTTQEDALFANQAV